MRGRCPWDPLVVDDGDANLADDDCGPSATISEGTGAAVNAGQRVEGRGHISQRPGTGERPGEDIDRAARASESTGKDRLADQRV